MGFWKSACEVTRIATDVCRAPHIWHTSCDINERKPMKNMILRLATEEHGSVHLYYALALLMVAIASRPKVTLGFLYQLEAFLRMFVGQFLSLV